MPTKIPEGLSCALTPEQVYCGNVPEIPDGWAFVRFGFAAKGDHGLLPNGGITAETTNNAELWIIVRRKSVKPRQWLVEFPNDDAALYEKVKVVREIKPITRQQVNAAISSIVSSDGYSSTPGELTMQLLVELGIEVEP